MALSTETRAWLDGLKKEGNISDEVFKQLETSLDGKADEYVRGSQLRQSDYSRVMAEVKTAQKAVEDSQSALATKEAAVTKYQGDLAQWKDGADKNFQKALTEREAATRKAEAAVARLRSMAAANGLDETEVLKDIDTVVIPKKDDVTPFDTSKFLTRDDAKKAVMESALIETSIHDLAIRHQELTGQPLRNASALLTEALQANMRLDDYAAKKFDYAKLEGEKTEAVIQKRIDDAVKARETQILSDGSIPGNLRPSLRDDLKGSPILAGIKDLSHLPPIDQAPGGGVSAAVAAFNSGKFKGGR